MFDRALEIRQTLRKREHLVGQLPRLKWVRECFRGFWSRPELHFLNHQTSTVSFRAQNYLKVQNRLIFVQKFCFELQNFGSSLSSGRLSVLAKAFCCFLWNSFGVTAEYSASDRFCRTFSSARIEFIVAVDSCREACFTNSEVTESAKTRVTWLRVLSLETTLLVRVFTWARTSARLRTSITSTVRLSRTAGWLIALINCFWRSREKFSDETKLFTKTVADDWTRGETTTFESNLVTSWFMCGSLRMPLTMLCVIKFACLISSKYHFEAVKSIKSNLHRWEHYDQFGRQFLRGVLCHARHKLLRKSKPRFLVQLELELSTWQ